MSSRAVVLDSSVWIDLLGNGASVKACQRELNAANLVIVPTLVLYEVYRKIASSTSEDRALSAIAFLTQHTITDLSQEVALTAADLSIQHKLAMADSFVLAHAHIAGALLVTLDNDFAGLPGTKVLRRN